MTKVLEIDGKYEAYVRGHLVGVYSTMLKALSKMVKYEKGQTK